MRIAYFSDNFYPEISGISDSIITTGEELRRRGHQVLYVGPRYAPRDYKSGKDPAREALGIVRLPSLPMSNSPTGQSRIALPIGASLRALRAFKPDMLHTQSPYGTGLEALLASRVLQVPLVGTNHTPIEEFVHYAPMGKYFEGPARRYDAWYYNRCAFVTAPYQGLIDNMRTRGFKRDGRAQANPVPFAGRPSDAAEKASAKRELNAGGPVLLCSGRLAPEKKVDDILKAAALLIKEFPSLLLCITGHGSAEESLKQLAASLAIEKNVRFMGFVNEARLANLYVASDAYVIMSTAETQSLSLMQAFAAGVPAVAAKARGLADYTPADAGFLVEPGDTAALAARLTELLNDDALRGRMGVAGAKFVETLSPAHIAQAWEKIYRDVLKH